MPRLAPFALEQTRRPSQVVVSDPASGRRIDVARYAPPPELAAIVDRFWTSTWDLDPAWPHRSEVLSAPAVHLVLEADASRVVGVHRKRFTRVLERRGRVLGTQLQPGAIRALSSRPACAWTDRMTPLAELWADAQSLEREALALDDVGAFALVARALAERAEPLDEGARLARRVVEHVQATAGVVRVEQLVEQFAMPKRALQRLFERYIGVTPKWAIRRVRLQEAAAHLEQTTAEGAIARIAIELGYADQAHFARDFKAVVGLAPGEFVKRRRAAAEDANTALGPPHAADE